MIIPFDTKKTPWKTAADDYSGAVNVRITRGDGRRRIIPFYTK